MKSSSFELGEVTIAELQAAMEQGKHSARRLTELYLDRIDAVDRSGPGIAAVLEINPDAIEIAEGLDRERGERGPRGPLHGIPILIKDNIDTADKMTTTAGSTALAGSRPVKDAHLISRLREAGAVILGKTNLSEWANIRSTCSTSGWSARGGLTRNPYALDRNTSGSSSGSAAAVSANLCSVAVGTETDGSIVSPASCCGVVGIKPTVGLISRTGVIPISTTQDTAGPLARTVADAAALLGAIAGADPADPATTGVPAGARGTRGTPGGPGTAAVQGAGSAGARAAGGARGGRYTPFLDSHGLKGMRIGVVRSYFGYHREVDAIAEEALRLLAAEGAALVDPIELKSLEGVDDPEFTLLQYELKATLTAYLGRLDPSLPVHSLAELIEFNEDNRETEMPYFGQEIFLLAQARGELTDREYLDARDACRRLSRTEGIDAVMDEHRLDALVAPTGAPAWLTDLVDGDHYLGGSAQAAAVAGYPSITLPAGSASGLPVGISFFGRAWSEGTLIRAAYAYEQASAARRAPQFKPTALP